MELNEKPNYKKFDIESDKPFFAAYLNTAKANLFIILRDISERLGLGFTVEKDDTRSLFGTNLWEKLKSNKEPEASQSIVEKLNWHFPFAHHLAENFAYKKRKERTAGPGDYLEVFRQFISQLYEYRNYYSHYEHDSIKMDESIIEGMRMLFDASRIKVKERFALRTEDVNHLVRLSSRKVNGKNLTYEKNEDEGFSYGFANDDDTITEKGFAFFICLWLQRKDAQLFLKKLKGFKRSESPSQKATLEAFTIYSAKAPQPKLTSDNSKHGLLLDMINELHRCPKELYPLLSDVDREKFKALDEDKESRLEEEYEPMPILKRNRNRFFYFALKYLDSTFQNIKFQIDLGNYCFHVYDQVIEGETKKRSWIKHKTAFGNLEDFDEKRSPKEWSEKVQKIDDRDRESADTYVTETTPHYHINGNIIGLKFIRDYENLKKENKIWPELPLFDNNNKEIHNPTKPRNVKPDCWLSVFELPAIAFYQLLFQKGHAKPSAEKIIEKHKGKIFKFFQHIEDGTLNAGFNDETLKQVLNKRGLKKDHIPKAIFNYLISKNIDSFEEKANKKLGELLEETNKMISNVVRQQTHYNKKPGSKDYIGINYGRMGDFLARDMIRLQKPLDKDKGKPNSTEFQILQAKIAQFSNNKDTLLLTFQNCNLVGSDDRHPFLKKIRPGNCKDIIEFYLKYLNLRKQYLKKCIDEKQYDDYHFLKLGERKRRSGKDYIKELAKELREETVMNLPRGLFLEPILGALGSSEETKVLSSELESMERVNAAYVIEKYFTNILNDKPQEFYDYKKSYELLNTLYDDRTRYEKRKTIEKRYFDTGELTELTNRTGSSKDNQITLKMQEKIERHIEKHGKKENFSREYKERTAYNYWKKYKNFSDNEKQIRLAKNCDLVLFMMVDNILRKEFVVDEKLLKKEKKEKKSYTVPPPIDIPEVYKLSDIEPNSDKGILNLQTRVELQMPFTYEANKDYLLKVEGAESDESGKQKRTIIRETIKIKNYGDFRGFLKDRRINSLLPYIPDKQIHFEALEKEMEWFNEARMEVFEKIHEFEKKVVKEKGLQKNDARYIKHSDILKSIIDETDERYTLINSIRNAFSHSEYPAYLLYKGKVNGYGFNQIKDYVKDRERYFKNNSIAFQFKDLIINKYNNLMKKL